MVVAWKILTDIGILGKIHILWESTWTMQMKEGQIMLNFQLQNFQLN